MFNLNEEESIQLTRAVMSLLNEWGINAENQLKVLALPDNYRTRHLSRFRSDTAFPDDKNVLERVEQIMGIAEALRTSYPTNERMGAKWMQQPHRRFDQRTPVDCMVQDGLAGVIRVRCHLDCAYDWQLDEQRARALLQKRAR